MTSDYDFKLEIFIPEQFVINLRDELAKVGAGRIGKYDHCLAYTLVKGYWRPLEGSNPFDGEIGEISEGMEAKVEINCRGELVEAALETIRRIHPYDEPLINIIPLANQLFKNGGSKHA
jgi:hypothetical protein